MVDVLEALGALLVEVDGLRSAVCWVPDQRVGLIRAGLDIEARGHALGWLISEACATD